MSRYKLIYFNYKGFAEPIRLALTHVGVPFEDVRIKYEVGWKEKTGIKPPFGVLPLLEVDGKRLPESMAILRYIGEKHGLQASDPWDRAIADAMATSWYDMQVQDIWSAYDWNTRHWDIKKVEKTMKDSVEPRLKYFDEHLSKSKSGYLAGDKVTWADFSVFVFLELLKVAFHAKLDSFPNLWQFFNKINDLPAVKHWHATHSDDTWGGGMLGPYGD